MNLAAIIAFWIFTAVGALFVLGTLLSLSRHPHWFVRGWDFPRVLIALVLFISMLMHAALIGPVLEVGGWYNGLFVAATLSATAWQLYKIVPYTPLAPIEVQRADEAPSEASIRVVASNVLFENDAYDRWLETIRAADPDLILALEVDGAWLAHLRVLEEDYPHTVFYPQGNCYGMALFSRLPLIDPKVRFIVEQEIPSIHTGVRLRGGAEIYFHGLHPRPPEPLRGTDSTQRDAEIVVMGREIRENRIRNGYPTIVAGDFNDVAWSRTTQLFVRMGELLDPRKGRGLYNTFNANTRLFRYPVDHVFHTNEFSLVALELLDHVGSDHFPVMIELCYDPSLEREQQGEHADAKDEKEADARIEQAEANGYSVDQNPI